RSEVPDRDASRKPDAQSVRGVVGLPRARSRGHGVSVVLAGAGGRDGRGRRRRGQGAQRDLRRRRHTSRTNVAHGCFPEGLELPPEAEAPTWSVTGTVSDGSSGSLLWNRILPCSVSGGSAESSKVTVT